MTIETIGGIHPFDAIVVIGAIIFLILGIKRGLIEELFRLAGIIGGFLIAVRFNHDLSPALNFIKVPENTLNAIAFGIIFIVAVIVIIAFGWLFKKVVHLTPAAWADWLFGGVFGIVKVLFIAWIFVLSVESSPFRSIKIQFDRSKLYPILASIPVKFKVPFIEMGKQTIIHQSSRIISEPSSKAPLIREGVKRIPPQRKSSLP